MPKKDVIKKKKVSSARPRFSVLPKSRVLQNYCRKMKQRECLHQNQNTTDTQGPSISKDQGPAARSSCGKQRKTKWVERRTQNVQVPEAVVKTLRKEKRPFQISKKFKELLKPAYIPYMEKLRIRAEEMKFRVNNYATMSEREEMRNTPRPKIDFYELWAKEKLENSGKF
ncbi:hypothetical protein KR018_007344 [Drosophila ironensis]|nr:hypothetical protein KR018_007344 [Drosophila ironensis]